MKRALLLVAILALVAGNVHAQSVPKLINYQGKLLDVDGEPLATDDYTLKFRIYDAAEGGNEVWGPQVFDGETTTGHGAQVPAVHGHFNVILGPVDEAGRAIEDAFSAADRYLEISVGASGSPLMPRQQILSAPFALMAQHATEVPDKSISQSKLSEVTQSSSHYDVSEEAYIGEITDNDPHFGDELIATIDTNGRPVLIGLTNADTSGHGYLVVSGFAGGYEQAGVTVRIYRKEANEPGFTLLSALSCSFSHRDSGSSVNPSVTFPITSFIHVDIGSDPGRYTYKMEFTLSDGRAFQLVRARMYALEL